MKALFIGDFNYITVSFASKLAKNGIDLAISNNSMEKPSLGFKYAKYNSDESYIKNIYENFRPDIIVFTATLDNGNYLDLLENVLSSANKNKIKRVIYISSSTVYGIQNEKELPKENTETKPKTKRALNCAIGEDICKRWALASETIVTILRISGIYGSDTYSASFNKIIIDIIDGKTINLNQNSILSFLHINDASEAFLQIFDTAFSDVYNISSGKIFTPRELKDMICEHIPEAKSRIMIEDTAPVECMSTDNTLLRKEYHWQERNDIKKQIPEIIKYQKKYVDKLKRKASKEEIRKERANQPLIFKKIWDYVETILLFLVLVYMVKIQQSVDLIEGINFVVIYLILVAVIKSLHQSALSLLLAIGLLVYQRMQMGYDVFSSIINNQTLLMAAEYCIVSIVVSYVVQNLKTKNQLMSFEILEKEHDMQQLQEFSEDNLKTRHFFEDQILEYDLSLPRIISMASRLDTLLPEKILPETIDIISESVGVKDVSAYFIGTRGGRMRLSYSKTEDAAKLGQSPLLEDLEEIISVLDRDEIYINRSLNEKFPSMVSGVKIDGRLTFVFTVWNLPFNKMRQDVSNLFKSITTLVSAALRRADQYEEITAEQRYITNTSIMRTDSFKSLCETRLSDDSYGSVLCKIDAPESKVIPYSKKIESLIRENDYLGIDSDGNLYVLLTGTTEAGYKIFAKRLTGNGINSVQMSGGIS